MGPCPPKDCSDSLTISMWNRTRPASTELFQPSPHGKFFDAPRTTHRIPKIRKRYDPSDVNDPKPTNCRGSSRGTSSACGKTKPSPTDDRVFVPLDGYEDVEKCTTAKLWRVRVAESVRADSTLDIQYAHFSTLPDAVRFVDGKTARAPRKARKKSTDARDVADDKVGIVKVPTDVAVNDTDDKADVLATQIDAIPVVNEELDEIDAEGLFVACLGDCLCLDTSVTDPADDWLMSSEQLDEELDGFGEDSISTATSIGMGDVCPLQENAADGTLTVREMPPRLLTTRATKCTLDKNGPFHSRLSVSFETARLPHDKVKEIVLVTSKCVSPAARATVRRKAIAHAMRNGTAKCASPSTLPPTPPPASRKRTRSPKLTRSNSPAKKVRSRALPLYDANGNVVKRSRGRPRVRSLPFSVMPSTSQTNETV